MIGHDARFCDYCQSAILLGQRWVREKIYDGQFANQASSYRYFHAEPDGQQGASCWEKRQLEREMARISRPRENTFQLRVIGLLG